MICAARRELTRGCCGCCCWGRGCWSCWRCASGGGSLESGGSTTRRSCSVRRLTSWRRQARQRCPPEVVCCREFVLPNALLPDVGFPWLGGKLKGRGGLAKEGGRRVGDCWRWVGAEAGGVAADVGDGARRFVAVREREQSGTNVQFRGCFRRLPKDFFVVFTTRSTERDNSRAHGYDSSPCFRDPRDQQ